MVEIMVNETIRNMSSDELATAVRAICSTGISPTPKEKEYLTEAAYRLGKLHRVELMVYGGEK